MSETNFEKKQLENYHAFVKNLVSTRSVLTKKFYIVLTYEEERERKRIQGNKMSRFDFDVNKKRKKEQDNSRSEVAREERKFELARKELEGRSKQIISQFRTAGMSGLRLDDKGLVELFYTSYNKNRSTLQPLREEKAKNYNTNRVKRKK